MRHALIIAGGSGTRLWPMSRAGLPKQLIPFIHGKSLLQVAVDRLEGVVPADRLYICAGEGHRSPILASLKGLQEANFLGEPQGRDTLNAVGLGAAVIASRDPDAVIAVFTADHVIEPVEQFRQIVDTGYRVAEANSNTLVTFGIKPTHAVTGYGYLELGEPLGPDARRVSRFKEKPDAPTAQSYVDAGPEKFLWNSGMFVWRASTLLDCIKRYTPDNHAGLLRIAKAWDTPGRGADRGAVLAEVYPQLKKISVDFAVMEPASRDPAMRVAAVPMPLTWLDVGSWPAFAKTLPTDDQGNAIAAGRHAIIDCHNTLFATSDPAHLLTAIGCDDLIIIHTPDATLVCRSDRAEDIKKLHALIAERFGPTMT